MLQAYNPVTIMVKNDQRLAQGKCEVVLNVDNVDIPTGIKAEDPVEAARKFAEKLGAQ